MRVPGASPLAAAIGLAAVLAASAVAPVGAAAPTDPPAPLLLSAGTQSSGGDLQLTTFAPRSVTIATGDSLTWRLESTEFHTVHFLGNASPPPFVVAGPDGVFLNPAATAPSGGPSYDGTGMASSGLLTQGQTYTLSFARPGTYEYVCAVHPEMKGSVVVKDGRDGTDTQASIDARRDAEVNANLAKHGVPLIMDSLRQPPTEGVSATITAGAGDDVAMLPRFLPERVTVRAGDTISWVWNDPLTPHTITFLDGTAPAEAVIPEPQSDGPPRLRLNPAVLQPTGDPTAYAGGLLNSGFLDPLQSSQPPTYSVRFDQPGTYTYVCLLHEGMLGTVVVEA